MAIALVLLAAAGFGWTMRTWRLVPLLIVMALAVAVDLRVRLVPDVLSLTGLVYALALGVASGGRAAVEAVVGAVVLGGSLLVLAVLSRGRIGGGDVKLAALLGAALGWPLGVLVVTFAHVVSGIVALLAVAVRRRRPERLIPVGAVMALFGAVTLIVVS